MSNQIIDLSVSRRTLMKGGAVAASMAAAPALNNWAFAKNLKKKVGQNIL